jgi:hypothetical protein
MRNSWIAERAAFRASSSFVGLLMLSEALSEETLDESKFVEGKTRLGLEGSRPKRRFGLMSERGRGPGPLKGPMMDATARPGCQKRPTCWKEILSWSAAADRDAGVRWGRVSTHSSS